MRPRTGGVLAAALRPACVTPPPSEPMPSARLEELRKEPAEVLLQIHLTPPMTLEWAALLGLYAPLEHAVFRAEREMGCVPALSAVPERTQR